MKVWEGGASAAPWYQLVSQEEEEELEERAAKDQEDVQQGRGQDMGKNNG